ncbi:SCO family protein [Oceanobacillus alkalisoli]|uniref:SCO family protein n=1 Tax=Oceanobacillus alkalisoli TaxID=2925113 RepID=UPI001EF1376D|nr:SCO family protein [Oceanobacillus alkalisoli]MCF3943045.1 SCO family protein [Oceanobacillus alkalisoli]MCG5104214.1 SCO family protein [Oceanobacillus alkalisoli]
MKVRKFLLLFIMIFLAACGDNIETNMSEPMVDFEFVTQDGKMLHSDELQDEWWVANFMYTNCRTVCPRTTANLAEVQGKLKEDGLSPQIVSFSVDPAYDTPEVLKEYAAGYDADLETWSFLTGYDFETIQEISEHTFKAVLEEGVIGQRAHGVGFYLIDPKGNIVKKYDGTSTVELDELVKDLKSVL